jgi:peptide deformylase
MNLYLWPHFTLERQAKPISLGEVQTQAFLNKLNVMFEVMYRHRGVGIAAPQLGWNKRIFVLNPFGRTAHNRSLYLINPQITVGDKLEYGEEGCLSLPNIRARVPRPTEVHVTSLLPDGKTFEATFEGFNARIVLHEYDHIEGRCFIHRLEPDELARVQTQLDSLKAHMDKVRSKRGKEPPTPPAIGPIT